MSEEFKEENTTGEIIETGDGEHEGWGWGNIRNIFRRPAFDFGAIRRAQEQARQAVERAARETRERIEREQRAKEARERAERERVANLETQVRQLTAYVSQLESKIRNKDILIDKKNKHITFLTREHTRLRKKVNNLLDNLQYYRTLVLGNKEVDGYQKTVVKQQIKNDELIEQEIGRPIVSDKKEGFGNLNTYYENLQEDINNLLNEYTNLEGFVTSGTTSYNAVFTENQAVKNQIDNTTNEYSVNNQISSNIIAKTNKLKFANLILMAIFVLAYLYGCYKIYQTEGMNLGVKVAICIVMSLTIFILHLIEYIILNIFPYISSLLIGTPYNPPDYWSKPGMYDYLPTP
jgi:hypothetical protein